MSLARSGVSAWSLQRRLAAAFAVVGLAVVAAVAVAVLLVSRVQDAQERVVEDVFAAFSLSNQLFTASVDSETGVRGYALTGDADFLEPYTTGGERRSATYQRLVELVASDPQVSAELQDAAGAAARWSTEWADPTVAAVQAGGPDAVSGAQIERGKDLFDEVRSEYGEYNDALAEARREALADLSTSTERLFWLVIVGALATVLAGLLLWLALARWVAEPLATLAREVRLVKEGSYDHRIDVTGPPEVTNLAIDVEAMRRNLVLTYGEAMTARHEVEAASQLLEEQARELRRSNTELEQFAYVASHDLQEPLRKVASFCQMLERRYKGQLDDRADQYIAFAVDGAKRMQQLINDLLAFSRVGRMSPADLEVDLDGVLDQALGNLGAAIEETGAEVTRDPLPTVLGDPGLLTQLFQNLVGNAIKFRGDERPRVHVGARLVEHDGTSFWELCCRDNGIGVDPQYADRIFVIFQRLHAKHEYDGTGIGLSLCKKIVEHHGGRIWLDQESTAADGPWTGATFRWTLPATTAGDEEAGPAAAPASAMTTMTTVNTSDPVRREGVTA